MSKEMEDQLAEHRAEVQKVVIVMGDLINTLHTPHTVFLDALLVMYKTTAEMFPCCTTNAGLAALSTAQHLFQTATDNPPTTTH